MKVEFFVSLHIRPGTAIHRTKMLHSIFYYVTNNKYIFGPLCLEHTFCFVVRSATSIRLCFWIDVIVAGVGAHILSHS